MSNILKEVLAANEKYASNFGDKAKLAMPPARHFAILTCMDARLDPAKFAGLSEGDAHVIRNAGGRASDDAIRSLVISYNCSARGNGSSSITPTAAWNFSRMRLCAGFSPTVWKLRRLPTKDSRMSAKVRARAPENTSNGLPSATGAKRPR